MATTELLTVESVAPVRRWHRRADLIVVAGEAVLLALAIAVGAVLNHRGVSIHANAAPLFARWLPHIGPGTPLAITTAAVVVCWGPGWARYARWPALLTAGYLATLAWILSLALIDGWSRGLATRLTPQAEYLNDVPKVTNIPAMLSGFTSHILDFQPGSWATHVAGHPPGALLVFVMLDRIGLSGGGPAALTCVLVGATIAISVPATLRALGHEPVARATLPFIVLFPGAVWLGASADAMFTGVAAAGLALLANRRWWAGFAGGVLLGFALYLSYGLMLIGALALAVVVLRHRDRWATLAAAALGATGVVVAFTMAGFWWLDGYHLVVRRYYQGWAADRPYGYWVWANLACLLLSAGPVIGPALQRMRTKSPATWLPLAATIAILAADLSGLSKAEVERIWLPYTIWLMPAVAWLPAANRRGWLIAQAVTALAVNHLLLTNW
jgi:hypothetical protein